MFTLLADSTPWFQNAWFVYPALIAAGFLAGVVNTIAGGGSFLTLPVLMYAAGLPPQVANATNRIAILFSTASASHVFLKNKLVDRTAMWRMLLPLLLGVPIGAVLAVILAPDVFQGVFGGLFLLMAIFFCFKPKFMLQTDRQPVRSVGWETLYFFITGIYVGFIQAGMGLLLLVGMSLFHARELVSANAIKNVIGFLITVLALSSFLIADFFDEQQLMHWAPGLVMAIGNLIGGIVGAKLAIKKGAKLIFAFVVIVMIATGIKLLSSAIG